MNNEDIARFNAEWLEAWTAKDVEGLCGFYAEDCVYKDPQTTAGLQGQAALRAYLTQLFGSTPPMRYTPDQVWPIPGGFCGRWYCTVGGASETPAMRGFDLVLLKGDRIALNEVYVHPLGG